MQNNCYFGGEYCNPSFIEVFKTVDEFIEAYHGCGIPALISDQSAQTLYYLIFAKYGQTPIKSNDTNLFAYRVFQIIFQYAPTWEKKLEIQQKVRALSLEAGSELFKGGKVVYNHASHDGSAPSTDTLDALSYIDSQNTSNYSKSLPEGYAIIQNILSDDVTATLLSKFSPLFSQWLKSDKPIYYVTEV